MNILLPLALGLAYVLTRQAGKLSTIEFNLSGARIHKITADGIQTYISLGYVNPSNASQTVQGLFFKIKKNGETIGVINRQREFTLDAKSQKSVEVPVLLRFQGAASSIISALTGQKMNITFDGYATVGGNEVPISKTLPFDFKGFKTNILNFLK